MESGLGDLIFHPQLIQSEIVDLKDGKAERITVECEFYAYPFMEKCELTMQRPILSDTWKLNRLLLWNQQRERYESVMGCYSPPLHEAVISQTLALLQKAEKIGA